jgi:hypothetical protein
VDDRRARWGHKRSSEDGHHGTHGIGCLGSGAPETADELPEPDNGASHAIGGCGGAVAERRADWSWTDSLDIAQTYAHSGIGGRPQSTVWTAEVDPARLLARISERNEDEYVVNTKELTIHEHH